MQPKEIKVGVGVTTLAGYGATIVGVIGIILVQALNVDEEQATLIATSVWTVVAFAITQFGRYQQAKELSKKVPVQQVVRSGSSSQGVLITDPGPKFPSAQIKAGANEMSREPKWTAPARDVVDPIHEERDIHEIDELL